MKRDEASLSGLLAAQCAVDWSDKFDQIQLDELHGIVRTAFVDTAACILAGRDEPVTQSAALWAGFSATDLPAHGHRGRLAAAAFINATCGHALDFDDVGLAGHPSVVLVPVLLAEHEAHGTRGIAIEQAYAKGYAVWAELQRRMKVHLHARGWHPTAVFGTMAAAVALASARHLPEAGFAHAIGIAASSAAGLIANFGSMTKSLQVGRAARAGIEAVEFAQAGIDASRDALNGSAGLLSALGGPGNAELGPELASDFCAAVLKSRPGIKKYPVCYAAHRIIDGTLDLAAAGALKAEEVERVDATLSTTTAEVLRHHAPANLAQARFSLEFTVATALFHGALGVREVSEANLSHDGIRELMRHIHTTTVDTRCPIEPSFAYEDRVVITMKSGATWDSGPIRFARGHAMRPLNNTQLTEKLHACARDASEAATALKRIDSVLMH